MGPLLLKVLRRKKARKVKTGYSVEKVEYNNFRRANWVEKSDNYQIFSDDAFNY